MASGRKRARGRRNVKPRGSQTAGTGSDLGSVGERDATRQWAQDLAARAAGRTAPGEMTDAEFGRLRAKLPPALRDLDPDDEVPVIFADGSAAPPDYAAELLGVIDQDVRMEDGTVMSAPVRIYRSLREITSAEMAADPRATTLHLDELTRIRPAEDQAPGPAVIDTGKPAPLGESATAIAGSQAETPLRVVPGDPRRLVTPASEVPLAFGGTRAAVASRLASAATQGIVQAGRDRRGLGLAAGVPQADLPDEVLARLEANTPGLAGRLARGLSADELGAEAGGIVKALQQAGAGPGSYSFGGTGTPPEPGRYAVDPASAPGRGPEIIVTDDLESVPDDGEPAVVIEDLDADDPDSGRLLIGDRDKIRRYHERARAADRRARPLIPATNLTHALIRTREDAEAAVVRTNWTGDQVMDQHAWLTSHYRTPSDSLADYLAFHIRNSLDQDHGTVNMFWPIDLDQGADIPEGRQLARLIARGLGDARSFQVTAPMVVRMRADHDDRPVGTDVLDEGWLPCPDGFAWLDTPWLQDLAAGYWLPVRAVSWERTVALARSRYGAYGLPGAGEPATIDSVRIVLWLLNSDDVAFGRWAGAEDRAGKVANQIGRLTPQQVVLLPFGARINWTGGQLRTNGEQMMGLVHTLWRYLGELIPKSRVIRPVAPAVARRVRKSLKHDELRVITLREYSYIGDPDPRFPQPRNWTCRWWVEEFYRHIDRYDDGTDERGRRRRHEAVPAERAGYVTDDDHDICAVCLANGSAVRITLVHTFAKGPTDKPFRTPANDRTLYRLSR